MKLFLLIALFVFSVHSGYCQSDSKTLFSNQINLPSFDPKTPEASSLMKAVLYPVDYSTGLPQIEIPIYDIKLKDGTTIPIKLTYHASGYKPSEVKQRVGIGWTLVAEPQISRSVNGEPDEDYFLTHLNHNELIGVNENRLSACYGGGADFQPDHFFYRLIGKSGKFVSKSPVTGDASKCFFTVPYEPISIQGYPQSSFNITDDNGYYYHFNTQSVHSKIQTKLNNYQLTEYPTVYKADEIVTPLNEVIHFNYSDYTTANTSREIIRKINGNSYTVWVEDPEQLSGYQDAPDGTYLDLGFGNINYMEQRYNEICEAGNEITEFGARIKVTTGKYNFDVNQWENKTYLVAKNGLVDTKPGSYNEVGCPRPYVGEQCNLEGIPVLYENHTVERFGLLSSIEFPGGTIEFYDKSLVAHEYDVLDYILIKDTQNNIIKKIKFITHDANTDQPRALLDGVVFLNAGGETEYSYEFEYYTSSEDRGYSSVSWNSWYSENAYPIKIMPVIYNGDILRYGVGPNGYGSAYDNRKLYNTWEIDYQYTPNRAEAEEFEESQFSDGSKFALKKITFPAGGASKFYYEPNKFEKYMDDPDDFDDWDCLYYFYTDGLRIKKIEYTDANGNLTSCKKYKYGKNEFGSGIPFIELKPEDFVITEKKRFDVLANVCNAYPNPCINFQNIGQKEVLVQTYLTQPIINPYYDVGPSTLYDEVAEYSVTYDNNGNEKSLKTVYKYDLSEIENVRPYRHITQVDRNTIYTPVVAYDLGQWKIGKLLSTEHFAANSNNEFHTVSKKEYKYKTIHNQAMDQYYIAFSDLAHEKTFMGGDIYNWDFMSPSATAVWGRILEKNQGVQWERNVLVGPEIADAKFFYNATGLKVLEEEREYIDGVTTIKKYTYNNALKHNNPTEMAFSGEDETQVEYTEKYTYSGDLESNPLYKRMMFNVLLTKERWKDNQVTFKQKNNYWFYNNGVPVADINNIPSSAFPALQEVFTGKNDTYLESAVKYQNYDSYGNPVTVISKGGLTATYTWGYNGLYPISKTVTGGANSLTETWDWIPLIGMNSHTAPDGTTTYYVYDSFGRLQYIKDDDLNIIKAFDYHYAK